MTVKWAPDTVSYQLQSMNQIEIIPRINDIGKLGIVVPIMDNISYFTMIAIIPYRMAEVQFLTERTLSNSLKRL